MGVTWKTRDGRVLPIREMDTDHLRNCVNMLRRNGRVTAGELAGMFAYASDAPDGAAMTVENEIAGSWPSKKLEAMEDEIARRGERVR